jgi:hypothetical protein
MKDIQGLFGERMVGTARRAPLPTLLIRLLATNKLKQKSPVAYLDAPEFAKFVTEDSARLIAAVKKIGKVE